MAGILLSLATAAPALAEQDAGPGRDCRDVRVPVSLAQGQPADHHIHGRLCTPSGHSPDIIQLLVPGLTYTGGGYWEFPDPSGGTDRYNYAAAANEAGFATLAIDRIGSGRSSHPLSTALTLGSNVFTVHQVAQAIRRGEITAPGGERFDTVVYVGHSYGTGIGWFLATDHGGDLDAAVFTGGAHVGTVSGTLLLASLFYPATLDPKFAGEGLDPGYLTTLPGTRDEFLYEPARFDPAAVELDERTKSTASATELPTYFLNVNRPLDVRVPTLLVEGELDGLACQENFDAVPAVTGGGAGPVGDVLAPFEDATVEQPWDTPVTRLGGTDCSSPQALVEDEGAHLGPHVPSLDAFILPRAPHVLNQALNSQEYFTAVNDWIAATLGR